MGTVTVISLRYFGLYYRGVRSMCGAAILNSCIVGLDMEV